MSRIGKKPILIPSGVECKLDGVVLKVKGPKGQLQRDLHPNMKIMIEDGQITVIRPTDGRINRSLHGLTRTLINNMIVGVTKGFSKTLNIVGVGDMETNSMASPRCVCLGTNLSNVGDDTT